MSHSLLAKLWLNGKRQIPSGKSCRQARIEPQRVKDEIIASWDKVFDLNRYAPNWDPEPDKRTIQATLWEIRMSQVMKVECFIAK